MTTSSLLSRARVPVADLVRSTVNRAPEPSTQRLRTAVTALFVLGGAVSAVLGVTPHLALVAAAGLFVSAWALPALLGAGHRPAPARTPERADGPRRRPTAVLVVLGAIAGCTAFGEGALTDWGALL